MHVVCDGWRSVRCDRTHLVVLQHAFCSCGDGVGHNSVLTPINSMHRFMHTAAGRAYLVGVPGAAYSILNSEELTWVMNWIDFRDGKRENALMPASLRAGVTDAQLQDIANELTDEQMVAVAEYPGKQ